ncbi:MAG: hypothetical protein IKM43_03230 [Clostridia bacterium]|nr:hypothetical protein [Clostridia bacterium]
MKHEATINKITQYEIAMIDNNISTVDFSKYMSKIQTLREQLYYSLISKAEKNATFRDVLIEDALRFILLEEKILCKDISNVQFYTFLKKIEETYQNLQELDQNNILLNAITTRLNNVISFLRNTNNERIADIYSLLNQIRELKEQEI